MNYLITCKRNTEVIKQSQLDEKAAINLYRKTLLKLQPMDETSADVYAINAFITMARDDVAQAIENTANNTILVFQVAEDIDLFALSCDDEDCECRQAYDYPDNLPCKKIRS